MIKPITPTRSRYLLALPLLLAPAFSPAARATTDYWNGTGASWNSILDWYTAPSGTAIHPSSVPGAADTAIFNTSNITSAQSVNLDANQSISGITFNSTGNVTLNSGSGTNTLTIGANGIADNASVNYINAATILSANQTWTNNSASIFVANATLNLSSYQLTLAGAYVTYLNGAVTGTGGINKTGTGVAWLVASNAYSGSTNINAGTLKLGSSSALGNSSFVTVSSGATLDLSGILVNGRTTSILTGGILTNSDGANATYSGPINNAFNNYNFTVSGIGNITLSGLVGGSSIITKSGNNTLTLSGAADNSGLGLVVNAGAVILAKTSSANIHAIGGGNIVINAATVQLAGSGGDQLWDGASVTANTGGVFDTNGQSETFATLTLNGGALYNAAPNSTSTLSANITLAADASTSVAANSTLAINGAISGNYNLNANGSGTLLLKAANTFTGNLFINQGATVSLGNAAALTANTTVSEAQYYGATLNVNGQNVVIGGLSGGSSSYYYGTILQNACATTSGIITVKNAVNNEFDGTIQDGAGSWNLHFIKDGPAALTLGGNNSFSGGWEAFAGTLKLASDTALGASSADGGLYSGATLDLNGHSLTNNSILVTAGTFTNSSTNPATVNAQIYGNDVMTLTGAGNITFTGQIQYTSLIANSNATVTLTGPDDNFASDVTVSSGTLLLAKSSDPTHHAFGVASRINGGTLALGGTGGDQIYDSATVALNSGAFDANGRSESFNTLSLQGTGINNLGALLNSAPADASLTLNKILLTANTSIGVSQPNASLTLNAPIAGNFTLTKVGQGTLILTAPNTFTGNLTIANGALALSGGSIPANLFNNAAFIYNSGSLAGRLFNAGTVTLNADLSLGNGLENDANFQLAPGRTLTLNGAGLDNEANFSLTGGTLNLPAGPSATNINRGTFSLAAPLNLNGASLNNAGQFLLSNAILSNGNFTNTPAGILFGNGTITANFTNSGTIAATGGLLSLPAFTNTGTIEMGAITASLNGNTITNNSTIEGFGKINNPITNTGTIEATGGNLILAGPLTNTGTLRASANTKLLLQNFPANAGLISLTGGTLDTNNAPLTNNNQITGYGTLATGGGGLTNNASITFTGGTSTINGNVTNNPGKTINIKYQPAIFTGNVTNNGTIKTTNTTVTFTGSYTGNQYLSDPATNIFQSTATISPGGAMTGSNGDAFLFNDTFTNNGIFSNAGNLSLAAPAINNGAFTQTGPISTTPAATFTNQSGNATFSADAKLYGLTISAGAVNITTSHFIIETTPSTKSQTLASLRSNIAAHTLTATNIPANFALALIDNALLNKPSFGSNPADPNSLLLAPELLGDANIDGKVDLSDLSTLLNHFGQATPNWTDGNFDNATTINLTDLSDVLNNFG
ncbi:MAG: beta strand repeat-containing protein, partial [Phycisphaerae bacterium]